MSDIQRWGRRLAFQFCLSLPALGLVAAAPTVDPLADPPAPAFPRQTQAPAPAMASQFRQEVLVSGLAQPRSLVALPDGNLLIAEGVGMVRVLRPDGSLSAALTGMPEMLSVGGRSLSDLVLDNNFADNRRVFLTYLAPAPGEKAGSRTAAERSQAQQANKPFQITQLASARLSEDLSRLENVQVIADVWGRRLLSAPDGALFVSTMSFDNALVDQRQLAQDLSSERGKFLRLASDGSIPGDNPFAGSATTRQEIFSFGHRDPDGMAIHPRTGELWAIEHGPMGGDEVNIIRAGKNYGWPLASYGKNYDGTRIDNTSLPDVEQPRYYWYPSVATSGLLFYGGDLFPAWKDNLFVGTMSPTQGKYLVRLVLEGDEVVNEEHLLVDHDRRVRALAQGTDGALYVLTDSEDNATTDRHFPGEVLKLTPQ